MWAESRLLEGMNADYSGGSILGCLDSSMFSEVGFFCEADLWVEGFFLVGGD
jgi:hypothetical protein